MAKRKKIGFLYMFHDAKAWAGGFYYFNNLVRALLSLDDAQKPHVTVFHHTDVDLAPIRNINYPYIEFLSFPVEVTPLRRVSNKLRRMTGLTRAFAEEYEKDTVSFVYPLAAGQNLPEALVHLNIVRWIPDFQHKHLPQFFTATELQERDHAFEQVAASIDTLVLSSEDAFRDYKAFLPGFKNRIKVLPFAVTLPDDYKKITLAQLQEKFGIKPPYLFAPNHFWAHKNHIVILRALNELVKAGHRDVKVVFTGEQSDYRNVHHFNMLTSYIKDHQLEEQVKFLGFIDKAEMLALMNQANAVVQPSLFEGWSTVVEEAKALNQYLLLSDLGVHLEQRPANCDYFSPHDEKQLASLMLKAVSGNHRRNQIDYRQDIIKFANAIVTLDE